MSSLGDDGESRSFLLRLEGYSLNKGLGVGKFVESGTFTFGGSNWRIRYYPDGWDSDHADYVSIALFLIQPGATEVKAKWKFSLLDVDDKPVPQHTGATGAHAFSTKTQGFGCGKFIKRNEFESSAYLKDDCFRIRCDVTVTKEIVRTVASSETRAAPFVVVVPPSDLHRHLLDLLMSKQGGDVTFEVGGETFAAHKYMLAARSSVFMAELFGPMKENTSTCVRIDDMEAKVFKAMLHFIYTDSLPPEIDEGEKMEMAQHLLVAADRYNLERLKLICEETLCGYIGKSTAATTLALAEQHGCDGLKKACFLFLASLGNLKAVMASDGYEHLRSSCPNILEELVANLAP